MNKIPLEIIIPVFNEGNKVVKLMELFQTNINTQFRVLFCYDLDNDNIFEHEKTFSQFNFEIHLIKNPYRGPCEAIKEGFSKGNSDCVIVYPADDFLNFKILDQMYEQYLNGNHIVAASRFMKGGSMKDCPLIKSILVRSASFTLYYLSSIPIKDAAILSNCPHTEIRKEWIQRILDHDGFESDDGGIEAWIGLGKAVGLSREDVTSLKMVAPAAKFAVDAYVNFARNATWQEAIASSLTELFAPHIHQQRLDTWPEKYPWVDSEGMKYFKYRLGQARRDVQHGLEVTKDFFGRSRALQERALEILQFKLDVLWALADAIMLQQCEITLNGAKRK